MCDHTDKIKENRNGLLLAMRGCFNETLPFALRRAIEEIMHNRFEHFVGWSVDNLTRVSYAPAGIEWCDYKHRVNTKFGRYLRKQFEISKENVSDTVLDSFVSECQTFDTSDNSDDYTVVRGQDIIDKYRAKFGAHSCMTYSDSPIQMYGENPNTIGMLCYQKGNLAGRALVWTVRGGFYMDRTYANAEIVKTLMRQYALRNNWFVREHNKLPSHNVAILSPDGESKQLYVDVVSDTGKWPYFDTFRWARGDSSGARLYNHDQGDDCCLDRCDGQFPNINLRPCNWCECHYDAEDLIIIDDEYYCSDCVSGNFTWSEIEDDYIRDSNVITLCDVRYNDSVSEIYAENNCHQCTQCESWYSSIDSMQIGSDSELYCESCFDEAFGICSDCEKPFYNNDLIEGPDNESYCENCFNDKFNHCKQCNETFDKDDLSTDCNCEDCQQTIDSESVVVE